MAIRASIDIGSNSTLLLIADVDGSKLKILHNSSTITALGKNLDKNGFFDSTSMDDTYETLKTYREIAKTYSIKAQDIIITATEASRVATNAKAFYQKIYDELKLKVNIITGKAEAHFSMLGVLQDESLNQEQITVMDIGGASTELILFSKKKNKILDTISTPVGVVRGTEWNEADEFLTTLQKRLEPFKDQLSVFKTSTLVCVAGTMTSVANMNLGNKTYDEKSILGFKMKSDQLKKLIEEHKNYTSHDFLNEYPFLGKRSKTIKVGLMIADHFCDALGVQNISVSTFGLRHGTILSNTIDREFIANG